MLNERLETLHAFFYGVAVRAVPGAQRVDEWAPPQQVNSLDT